MPCKKIAPIYEQLSASLSRPNHITFVKVNVDTQKEIASKYAVSAYVFPFEVQRILAMSFMEARSRSFET